MEDQTGEMADGSSARRWTVLVVVAGAMAAGLLLRQFHASSGASQAGPLGFVMHSQAKRLDNVAFITGDGASSQLADLKGKVVLLNIWATWCPPCRKEMPSLDRLQAKLGGSDFEVVALSIDTDAKGLSSVKTFYTQVGIRHLRIFQDPTGTAGFKLGTVGVPTTLLIDRQGRELGRLTGTAEWDGGEALTLVRGAMAAGRAAP